MEALSDLEKTLIRASEAQERVTALVDRIERLKAAGVPTTVYEQLLRTLQSSLHLMQAHIRRSTDDLVGYRCYFMSGEHIHAVRVVECADDAEVVLKASEMLETHPQYQAVEVWERKRLVAQVPRAVRVQNPGRQQRDV